MNSVPALVATDVIIDAGHDRVQAAVVSRPRPDGDLLLVILTNGGDHETAIHRTDLVVEYREPVAGPVRLLEIGLQSTDIDVGSVVLEPGQSYTAEHAAFVSLDAERHLVVGFATARRFLTSVRVRHSGSALSFTATCLTDPLVLAPGQTVELETVLIVQASRLHVALEAYGESCADLMGVASEFTEPPRGWLSWYCFYGTVTEDDILRQLDVLAREYAHTRPRYVVIDSGWYAETGWGDWFPNEKFPHGMAWLADRIREAGFTPGLWFSPLLVSATSELARQRPDLLLRDGRGRPVPTMGTSLWDPPTADGVEPQGVDIVEDPAIRLALDLGSDAVHAWLRELFTRVRHEWGYEFIKLDFLIRAMITDRGLDPRRPGRGHDLVEHTGLTPVEAYRSAMATIRSAVGDDCFILGCAAPLVASAGSLIDANRMTPDITRRNYGESPAPDRPSSWDLVVLCARSLAARGFLNGRLGWNDPDVLVVRDAELPGISDSFAPTVDEARVWATVVGLSGGLGLLGDDLSRLSPERRLLTSAALPPIPRAAVPWDMHASPAPSVWTGSFGADDGVERPFVALFNWSDDAADVAIPTDALVSVGIDPTRAVAAVDLWTGRALEIAAGAVHGLPLAPRSARWLWVGEWPLLPAVIGGTTRDLHATREQADALVRVTVTGSPAGAAPGRAVIAVPDGFTLVRSSATPADQERKFVTVDLGAGVPVTLDFVADRDVVRG